MFDDFFEILAEDNELIIIRKSILKICDDDMIATAILSKSIYYSKISKFDDRRFYKFKEPCDEANGDSWCEILGLKNKYKFDKALTILKDKNFIKTKTDMSRKTYYFLNFGEIKKAINNYNTLTNEQKQPLKAKTEAKEYKDTTEQEKTLKTQDLVLKTTQKTEKSEIKAENNGDLVLKIDKKPKQKTELIYNLPFFVDSQIFKDFINHRKEIKKPMTQNAVNATIKKLCDFHAKGYDCNEILNNSIANGWQGIFEPQQARQGAANANKSISQRLAEQEARILAKYENQNSEMIDCEILGG